MDVREAVVQRGCAHGNGEDGWTLRRSGGRPSRARIGEALGEWQAAELRLAWRYPQCRGLARATLEDLYQETVLALLNRPFFSEEHLRNALRLGLRHRALHVHRDERRRAEILSEHAPEAHLAALGRHESAEPERAALAHEDGLIVLEFACELTALEQRIYGLEAEGLRYRAIAPIIAVDVNETRKASRSLQAKRARFQLLHDTGRLCGYRAPTIEALLAGEATSEQLAKAAFAHVEACASCRAEHKTNSGRLRRSFQERAAAVLPAPILAAHLGWLARIDARVRTLTQRWPAGGAGGEMRERAIAMATTGGVSAKLAAGAATVAVIAGGTLGASHVLSPPRHAHARSAHRRQAAAKGSAAVQSHPALQSERHSVPVPPAASETSRRASSARVKRREPGGFAFLGVPGGTRPTTARTARAANTSTPAPQTQASQQTGGGPFSP
jgi:hypothetical protein